MNVSDPAAVDPKMTANLLQEHGITATGSLVRVYMFWHAVRRPAQCTLCRRAKSSQTLLPDRAAATAIVSCPAPALPRDEVTSVTQLQSEDCGRATQGLSFDADVSSEDAEVVERGKARLRQALQVRCRPSAARNHRRSAACGHCRVCKDRALQNRLCTRINLL